MNVLNIYNSILAVQKILRSFICNSVDENGHQDNYYKPDIKIQVQHELTNMWDMMFH